MNIKYISSADACDIISGIMSTDFFLSFFIWVELLCETFTAKHFFFFFPSPSSIKPECHDTKEAESEDKICVNDLVFLWLWLNYRA